MPGRKRLVNEDDFVAAVADAEPCSIAMLVVARSLQNNETPEPLAGAVLKKTRACDLLAPTAARAGVPGGKMAANNNRLVFTVASTDPGHVACTCARILARPFQHD